MIPTIAVRALAGALLLLAQPPPLAARCERGAADACRERGRSLVLGDAGRPGPAARLGVAHVTLACELGDAPACGDLGALHALGRGVAWDAARATALSRRACEAGVGFACANWGVLAAEDAGGLAAIAGKRTGVEVRRRFRTACDAGAAEGCLDLAVALRAGVGGASDAEGAARALARGCDLGLALACHRLALLVPEDPRAADARRRACRAAVVPACEAAGLPVPSAGVASPSPRLVEDPGSLALGIPGAGGFHPADLAARGDPAGEAGASALEALVPDALRAGLGLEGAPGAVVSDQAIDLLLSARRLDLAQCLDVARSEPGKQARLAVAFLVGTDGRAGAVRAASEPPEPGLNVCASETAAAWEFPTGERRAGPFTVAIDVEPLPGGGTPVYPGGSGHRPALRDPGCPDAAARVPPGFAPRSVTLKLAVGPDGEPALLHALTAAPDPVIAAAVAAVRACPWLPGAGPEGRPASVWTTVTVRVGDP